MVGNRTVYIYADECAFEVSLNTQKKRYVEAIEYINSFLEETFFPPKGKECFVCLQIPGIRVPRQTQY